MVWLFCYLFFAENEPSYLLAGSARPDMPGASEGPAPIMRVFGITMEGNSGQDTFISEQVLNFLQENYGYENA
jgi:hypothetical protein